VGWTRSIRRSAADIIWFEVLSVVLGIVIGVVTCSYQSAVNSSTYVGDYQNFGITTGAIVGTGACLLGIVGYIMTSRFVLHYQWFHFKFFLVSCALTGALASFVTYAIVGGSGPSHGMVEREVRAVVADGVMSAVIGGIFGLSAGWVVAKSKGVRIACPRVQVPSLSRTSATFRSL